MAVALLHPCLLRLLNQLSTQRVPFPILGK